jgi:hypothetical protein
MDKIFTINCPACKKIFDNHSALNKHIENCIIYESWIENYIPTKTFNCENCKIKFAYEEYLISHKSNCKN